MSASSQLLDEQVRYYRERAGEYDRWWKREGRYDRGPEATKQWRAEVIEVEHWLEAAPPAKSVLELACGTGWWTEQLAQRASALTCVDASREVIAINRARLTDAELPEPTYELADLFSWRPSRRYDLVFFSFWLSHVPRDRFDAFWRTVAGAVAPGGRAMFIDSVAEPTSTAIDHRMPGTGDVQERRLDDGRAFRVVKRFYDPVTLSRDLHDLGWAALVQATGRYFLFGVAERAPVR